MLAHTTPWIDRASVIGSMSSKHPTVTAALELLDERLEHRGVRGLYQFRRGEHLGLRLRRQAAQVGFDVVVEREVESAVHPGRHRLDASAAPAIFACSLAVSARAISRNTAATSSSFDSK